VAAEAAAAKKAAEAAEAAEPDVPEELQFLEQVSPRSTPAPVEDTTRVEALEALANRMEAVASRMGLGAAPPRAAAPAPQPKPAGNSTQPAAVSSGPSLKEQMEKELMEARKKKTDARNDPNYVKPPKNVEPTREKVANKIRGPKTQSSKPKIVRPRTSGYEGADLLKLAYAVGTRSQKANETLEIKNEKKDAVLIMDCEDVNVEVKGLCKNVSIAGCNRFFVSVEGAIGQVEVSNCQSGYVSISGRIYQLTADKCNGLEVTLAPDAYDAKIVSSMCASFNIALDNPDKSAEMELLALAVPTQYESVLQFDESGLKVDVFTTPVSHNFG